MKKNLRRKKKIDQELYTALVNHQQGVVIDRPAPPGRPAL